MIEDQTVRRRALAFAGVWLLVCGLLTALSLIIVVLALNALLLLGALAFGGARVVRRLEVLRLEVPRLQVPRLDAPHVNLTSTRQHAVRAGSAMGIAAKRANRVSSAFAGRAVRAASLGVSQARAWVERVIERRAADPMRRAHRLNARGTELRRKGEYQLATEQHFAALELTRKAGDPQAEAMTLNNLALALAKSGADGAAVHHFKLARDVLQQLGDAEHEAQVLANLGMVHRRQGRSDEATDLLHEALAKLPPESPAYHRVEAVLRRAS